MIDKNLKVYQVSVDSDCFAISLVDNPAIESDFIALAKQETVKLLKEEKHMIYGPVLRPDFPIYRNDGENEYYISFSKESIEKMSQDFIKNYYQKSLTINHEEYATELCVVESWIKYDKEQDKSVALGLDSKLPVGTWFAGVKVNNVDTWEKIKNGELKGFSIEAFVNFEEFSKQEKKTEMKAQDESFWVKMKEIIKDAFCINTMLEDTTPHVEPQVQESPITEPTVAEPTVEEPVVTEPIVEEPTITEPTVEPQEPTNEPQTQEPSKNEALDEVVKNLLEEIKALKESNNEMIEKIKTLEKEPSAKPINVNAKNGGINGDSYAAWREQMRNFF